MIEAIIFDLGDVFLNLNHQASTDAFKKLGLNAWTDDLKSAAILFETGKIDELQFMETIQKHLPNANLVEIREAWNAIIGDFPLERLEFLEKLQNKYNIFLLSNTNPTHIDKFEHRVGLTFAREFYAHFNKIYFCKLLSRLYSDSLTIILSPSGPISVISLVLTGSALGVGFFANFRHPDDINVNSELSIPSNFSRVIVPKEVE